MALKVEMVSTGTYPATIFKKGPLTSQKGFSLLEILIAIALVAIITAIAVQSTVNNDHEDLEESCECKYLYNGLCSEGCSCSNVLIEEECPFMEKSDFESCCCYEPVND
mgnify:CR=1 FL=1